MSRHDWVTSSSNGNNSDVQNFCSRPACKQHTAVDDLEGILLDVGITTGEEHDTGRLNWRLNAIQRTLAVTPGRITADTIWRVGRVYTALEERQIDAVIPPLRSPRRKEAQG